MSYGSIPDLDLEEVEPQEQSGLDEDDDLSHYQKRVRRWSVLEKLDKRVYCQVRTCTDCLRVFNCRCLLAICMLVSFLLLAVAFADVLFFASELGPVRYDYIIVGGGPAGSLLASKLASPDVRVLLLEAGDATLYSLGGSEELGGLSSFDVPFMWSSLANSPRSEYRWPGLEASRVMLTRGLGGCGVTGAMMYLRALPSDIRAWGVPGWDWPLLLKSYRAHESFLPLSSEAEVSVDVNGAGVAANFSSPSLLADTGSRSDNSSFHGASGPIATTSVSPDPLGSRFIAALSAATGALFSGDFNAPEGRSGRQGRVGHYHFNIDAAGQRSSAAGALLPSVSENPSVVLALGAHVRRVLLQEVVAYNASASSSHVRAVGVEYVQGGVVKTAYLRSRIIASLAPISDKIKGPLVPSLLGSRQRAVILAAGALHSPAILLRSGVGPPAELKRAGVECRVPLEGVGAQLQNHPTVAVSFYPSPDATALYPSALEALFSLRPFLDSFASSSASAADGMGVGGDESTRPASSRILPWSGPGFSAGGFLSSPWVAEEERDLGFSPGPDLQLTLHPEPMDPQFVAERARAAAAADGYRDEAKATTRRREAVVTVSLLRADARLQVRLSPTDPFGPVSLVNPLHTDPSLQAEHAGHFAPGVGVLSLRDRERLAWGVGQVRLALAHLGASTAEGEEASPGAAVSNADLPDWVARNVLPGSNWAGSCRMGPSSSSAAGEGPGADEAGAVVGPDLAVRGVENLRVADASVFPLVTNGPIHATVLAVADIFSDSLLEAEKATS